MKTTLEKEKLVNELKKEYDILKEYIEFVEPSVLLNPTYKKDILKYCPEEYYITMIEFMSKCH